MRYVFVDDSPLPYDGFTPLRRPLGGPEKAVIGIASALFARGHDVKVINRASHAHVADGAYWIPIGDAATPKATDVLIALRKPTLLGAVRAAARRVLWVMGTPDYLAAPANAALWDSFHPVLLFVSNGQQQTYKGKIRRSVIVPGVRSVYFEKPKFSPVVDSMTEHYGYDPAEEIASQRNEAMQAVEEAATPPPGPPPPHAVVTAHPLHGLDWLVDVWTKKIHPKMPTARLAVYSAVLSKGIKGEEVPAPVAPVLKQVMAAAAANVVVVDPLNDEGMADVYRSSRVHLYPGDAQDFACWTLQESQAAGLPAVARALGGVDEHLDNGSSGYIVPDAEAFANVTLQILKDDAFHKNMSEAAALVTRRRAWAMAAEELDALVATIPAAGV